MSKLTKLKEMTSYLKDHAQAREGKNRYKALVARARRKYKLNFEGVNNTEKRLELFREKIKTYDKDGGFIVYVEDEDNQDFDVELIEKFLAESINQAITEFLSDQLIENIIFDGLSDNRLINRVQQLNEDLRGSDYEDESKKIKIQEVELQLGYSPGYNQDVKKLKTLFN